MIKSFSRGEQPGMDCASGYFLSLRSFLSVALLYKGFQLPQLTAVADVGNEGTSGSPKQQNADSGKRVVQCCICKTKVGVIQRIMILFHKQNKAEGVMELYRVPSSA